MTTTRVNSTEPGDDPYEPSPLGPPKRPGPDGGARGLKIRADVDRPAAPMYGAGRFFRKLIGIREPLLDWVPEERARYSRMGAVVLCTALLAAASMLIALTYVSNAPIYALLPVALMWGGLILAFDSWLIASTHGSMRLTTLWTFVPRLAVAVLIGVIVAEPLIMTVFKSSLSGEVKEFRTQQLTDYRAHLVECNPSDPAIRPPVDCADAKLNLPMSPASIADRLTKSTGERDQLQAELDRLNKRYNELVQIAQRECAGTDGPGLTGQRGEGGQCRYDREEARKFSESNQISEKSAALSALNANILRLAQQRQTASATYTSMISKAIDVEVEKRRSAQERPGLLDAGAALGRLAQKSAFVFAAEWLLRLLLVAIDLLPVLVKVLGGKTAYDSLTSHQLDHSLQMHQTEMELAKRKSAADYRSGVARIESDLRHRITEIQDGERVRRADKTARRDEEIIALAAQLRGNSQRARTDSSKATINTMTKQVPMSGRSGERGAEAAMDRTPIGRQVVDQYDDPKNDSAVNGRNSLNEYL